MLLLTLPFALASLSFLFKSTTLLSRIESSPEFEPAWNANLNLAVAMSKDPEIAQVLNPAELKMLKDVSTDLDNSLGLDLCNVFNSRNISRWSKLNDIKKYFEKNVSPLMLFTVLRKLANITSVQTIIKEYPELEVALNLTKGLAIKITEDFGPRQMTPEAWKQLLMVTRMEITENIIQDCENKTGNFTDVCDSQESNTTKFQDLANTKEEELNSLFLPLVPKTLAIAMNTLQIGHLLKLPLLINSSTKILEEALSVENAVQIYQLTIKTRKDDFLKNLTEALIFAEFDQVTKKDKSFLALNANNLLSLLSSDKLIVEKEYLVFEAIVRWVEEDLKPRKTHVTLLMSAVRLHLLNYIELKLMLNHILLLDLVPIQTSIQAVMLLIEKDSRKLAEMIKKERRYMHETLFVVGGGSGTSGATIETLSTNQEQWVYNSSFNYGKRDYVSAVAVGKKIITFDTDSSSVNSFDTSTKEWKHLGSVKGNSQWFAVTELAGVVYILGGHNKGESKMNGYCWSYEPERNYWSSLPSLNTRRRYAAAASLQGKIYVAGGNYDSRELNEVEVFQPGATKWTFVKPMGPLRQEFALVADGNYLWAFGGKRFGASTNEVDRYDPITDTWSRMPSMPSTRFQHTAVFFSGDFYIIGGFELEKTVDIFDPSTETWRNGSELNFGRSDLGVCVFVNLPNAADFS